MTRPASSDLGIARVSLMILNAKVFVRALSSVGFMARIYKPNRQSAIGNRQFKNEIRASKSVVAAAGGSAGARAVFLVGGAGAATAADAIRRGAAAGAVDGRDFAGPAQSAAGLGDFGGGLSRHHAGAAA